MNWRNLISRMIGITLLAIVLGNSSLVFANDGKPEPRGTFTSCAVVTEIPEEECDALVALYTHTDGAGSWDNKDGWLVTDTPCSWYGITCLTGQVTSLNLSSNSLSGTIPADLEDLIKLKWLYLDHNILTGTIPSELGNLPNLLDLGLVNHSLEGSIPTNLSNLSSLEVLYLGYNDLSGNIPSQLGGLSNLQDLSLSNNDLDGTIPPQLGTLSNLKQLTFNDNNLTGKIPDELGNLSALQTLMLNGNPLTGPLPLNLTNLSSLSSLTFFDTYLCEPGSAVFQSWLSGVSSVSSTDRLCHAVADFNGDGRSDISVYRLSNGRWYIYSQGSDLWGLPGDRPIPADYDGDGSADIAVYRPSNLKWYIPVGGTAEISLCPVTTMGMGMMTSLYTDPRMETGISTAKHTNFGDLREIFPFRVITKAMNPVKPPSTVTPTRSGTSGVLPL